MPAADRLRETIAALIDRARKQRIPVVFLQNDGPAGTLDEPGSPGWQLALPVQREDLVIRKTSDDGFAGTGLDRVLAEHGAACLAVVGAISEMCVAATVRSALQHGFEVLLPHDGHGTYDVPAGPGGSPMVPAALAARAAEWSMGDAVTILGSAAELVFVDRSAG